MLKRTLYFILMLAMLLSMAVPAFSEEADAAVDAAEAVEAIESAEAEAPEAETLAPEETPVSEVAEDPEPTQAPEVTAAPEAVAPAETAEALETAAPAESAEAPAESEAPAPTESPAPSEEPPVRVKLVEATNKGIRIRWDTVDGVRKYRVLYRVGSGKWTKLADVAADNYVWQQAENNKDYAFTVRCLNASGKPDGSPYDQDGIRFRRLKTPGSLTLKLTTQGLELSWKKVSGASRYLVKLKDGEWKPLEAVEDVSYLFTDVESGSKYNLTVCCVAEDGVTPVSGWDSTGVSSTWLTAPEVQRVEAAASGIKVQWNEIPGAVNYRVLYRLAGSGESWKKAGETTGTSLTWKQAKAGKSYEFTVRCINKKATAVTSGMFEDSSDSLTFLAAPKLVSAKTDIGGATVEWKAVAAAQAYEILGKTGTEKFHSLALVPAGVTTYTWTGAESGKKYTFTVRCVTADGTLSVSGYDSTGLSAKYLSAPVAQAYSASNGIHISWDAVPGAAKYRVLYKVEGAKKWSKLKDTTSTSYNWTAATSGTRYAFTVACINKDGTNYTSAYDPDGVSATYVAAPKLTQVIWQNGDVLIAWDAVPGADTYRVLRNVGGEWVTVEETKETSYVWSGEDAAPCFTVCCTNSDGEVSGYDEAGATPVAGMPVVTSAAWNGNDIKVKWQPVDGAVNYRVLYRTGSGAWKKAGEATGKSFTWKNPNGSKSYAFTVCCVSASGTAITSAYDEVGVGVPVAMNKLKRYSYFRKYMTEAQFKQAYNIALKIVQPLMGLSREEQLVGIANGLRRYYDENMEYDDHKSHYNDPYGYFVLKYASCAGCTRATGMCLNMLGIDYEHVNENQWKHQWTRVKVGSEYWICDAYGLYCGPEPAPYQHPTL